MSEKRLPTITSIGGQALIEGVMMKGKGKIAIAVRKPDGDIIIKEEKPLGIEKTKWVKIPLLRGVVALIASMIVGVRALTYSAEFYMTEEEQQESRFETFLRKVFGKRTDDVLMGFSIVFAFVFAMLLFGVLPTLVVSLLKKVIENTVLLSAIEGLMKIAVFMLYISVIGRMKDVKRVFEYHGAEHKTIHCFESGMDVTVENARKFTTLHPRCGTSFIFFVLAISIVLFTFLSWDSLLMRVLMKLLLFPVVAGISYEFIKIAGKSTNKLIHILSLPGLWMQKLTTREPDDAQLEVAIEAFLNVLEPQAE